MKTKKIIAFAAALAMISGASCGTGIFKTDTVSAMGIVAYELDVSLQDYTIMIPEGTQLNKQSLVNNGISITSIMGSCHDMQTDPEYGTITKSNITKDVSVDDCRITFPEEVKEGKNTIKFSYIYPNEPYTSSTEISVDVVYCDEYSAENKVQADEKNESEDQNKEPVSDNKESTGDDVPSIPVDHTKKVTFGMTDSVVQPGDTTYVDIDISENSGFCTIFLKLLYDENVFTLESLSATPEFTGKDYYFDYSISNKKLIFSNNCMDNMKQTDSSIIRLAFKVNENAPEGDYSISMAKGDSTGIVSVDNQRNLFAPDVSFTSSTVSVSKSQDPKTNVSSMPLGRVYAQMDDSQVSNKTGDLTGDGVINALDALKLSKYLLGTSDTAKNGDTTEDGKVNILDYMKLKTYIIGG